MSIETTLISFKKLLMLKNIVPADGVSNNGLVEEDWLVGGADSVENRRRDAELDRSDLSP